MDIVTLIPQAPSGPVTNSKGPFREGNRSRRRRRRYFQRCAKARKLAQTNKPKSLMAVPADDGPAAPLRPCHIEDHCYATNPPLLPTPTPSSGTKKPQSEQRKSSEKKSSNANLSDFIPKISHDELKRIIKEKTKKPSNADLSDFVPKISHDELKQIIKEKTKLKVPKTKKPKKQKGRWKPPPAAVDPRAKLAASSLGLQPMIILDNGLLPTPINAIAKSKCVPAATRVRMPRTLPSFQFTLPTEWASADKRKLASNQPSTSAQGPMYSMPKPAASAELLKRSFNSPFAPPTSAKVEAFLSTFQTMEASWRQQQLERALAAQRKTELALSGVQSARPCWAWQLPESDVSKSSKGSSTFAVKGSYSSSTSSRETSGMARVKESIMSIPEAKDPSSLDWLYKLAGVNMTRKCSHEESRLAGGGRSPPSRRRPGSASPRRRRSPSPRTKLGQPMRPRRMSKSPVRRPISPARRAFSPVTGPFRQRVGPPQDRSRSRSPRRHLASPKRGRSRSRSPSVVPLSPVHRAQLSPLRSRAQLSPVGRVPDKLALSAPPQHMRPIRGVDRPGPPGPYRAESGKVLESAFRNEAKREEAPRNEATIYRQQRESALANSRSQMPAMGSYEDRGKRERFLDTGGSAMAREGPADAAGLDTDLRHRSGRSTSPHADSFSQSDKRYSAIPLLDGTTQTFRDHKSSSSSKTVEESNRRMGYDLNLEDRPLVGERFCGGENSPASGRMYTHDELKKITVDIRRTVPSVDSSSAMGRVINPHNVVVIRRPEEGSRPIFDRDEIRQAHAGHASSYRGKGGEGDFAERRVVAIVKERSRSPHSESSSTRKHTGAPGAGIDEREDFQVSRERYESFGSGDEFRKGNEQQRRPTTLSEKWATYSERGRLQGPPSAVEKPAAPIQQMRSTVGGYFSSGERVEMMPRSQYSPDRRSPTMMFRSRSPDTTPRDAYLDDRMRSSGLYAQQQPERHSSQQHQHHHHHELQSEAQQQQHYPRSSEDSRHQLGGKRRSQIGEVVRNRHNSPPLFERRTDRQPDDMWDKDSAPRKRFRDDDRNAPDTTTDAFYRESYRENVGGMPPRTDKDLFRQEMKDTLDSNLPNFASRPDKYRYQEWIDKPDMVPKGPSYYEHDNRGESSYDSSWFGRGRGRGTVPVRGRARGRATPFARGRILSRGGGNGGGVGERGGRGMMMNMPNRRKPSPNQWKHDMFDEISPDRKSESDNKPTSTTEGK